MFCINHVCQVQQSTFATILAATLKFKTFECQMLNFHNACLMYSKYDKPNTTTLGRKETDKNMSHEGLKACLHLNIAFQN